MFEGLKNLANLRKQASQLKETLAKETIIGTALDGKVQIIMNGNQEVKEVKIDPELLNPENKQDLERAIKECLTQCITQIQMLMMKKMQEGKIGIQ